MLLTLFAEVNHNVEISSKDLANGPWGFLIALILLVMGFGYLTYLRETKREKNLIQSESERNKTVTEMAHAVKDLATVMSSKFGIVLGKLRDITDNIEDTEEAVEEVKGDVKDLSSKVQAHDKQIAEHTVQIDEHTQQLNNLKSTKPETAPKKNKK